MRLDGGCRIRTPTPESMARGVQRRSDEDDGGHEAGDEADGFESVKPNSINSNGVSCINHISTLDSAQRNMASGTVVFTDVSGLIASEIGSFLSLSAMLVITICPITLFSGMHIAVGVPNVKIFVAKPNPSHLRRTQSLPTNPESPQPPHHHKQVQ